MGHTLKSRFDPVATARGSDTTISIIQSLPVENSRQRLLNP